MPSPPRPEQARFQARGSPSYGATPTVADPATHRKVADIVVLTPRRSSYAGRVMGGLEPAGSVILREAAALVTGMLNSSVVGMSGAATLITAVATDVPETSARMTRVAWPPSGGSTAPRGQAIHTRRDAGAKTAGLSWGRAMPLPSRRRLGPKARNFRPAGWPAKQGRRAGPPPDVSHRRRL